MGVGVRLTRKADESGILEEPFSGGEFTASPCSCSEEDMMDRSCLFRAYKVFE